MVYQFQTHACFVAACEQLADDLVDFKTDCCELLIEIIKGEIPKGTKKWLRETTINFPVGKYPTK